ncbi:hypothetical protein J3E72DRAFT_380188 [Bipolaris maydis]|nr:hypothetical protein J3E72DRAFT_380188 [Bipolaris maydis]
MKFINLVATTLPLLATSHPRAGPKSEPSDVWIGLDLKQCLTDANSSPLPNLAAQQDTARAVIAAYNAWDIDDIMAYRSPDCKHRVLPASMNRAPRSNAEYQAYLSKIMHLYSNFTVTVKEEVHDAAARKCIIHATSRAETKIGPYTNEYALILTFTEDGRKMTKFDEFVDSAYSEQFVPALAKELPPQ